MFTKLKKIWTLRKLNREWRGKNAHNSTVINRIFDISCVSVGRGTYGKLNVFAANSTYKLSIGNYCSIADEVYFLLCADHRLDCLSTFPFKAKVLHTTCDESVSKGNIIVGDDVWIGSRAMILSNVHIGQGAVIAAGGWLLKIYRLMPWLLVIRQKL